MCSRGNGTSKSFRRFAFRQALGRLDDITPIPGVDGDPWQYSTKSSNTIFQSVTVALEYTRATNLDIVNHSNGCRKELEDRAVELNVLALQGAVTGRHEVDDISQLAT